MSGQRRVLTHFRYTSSCCLSRQSRAGLDVLLCLSMQCRRHALVGNAQEQLDHAPECVLLVAATLSADEKVIILTDWREPDTRVLQRAQSGKEEEEGELGQ